MREINIKLTESLLLNNTGYTVEQLADANGYQSVVPNPDYVPAILNMETMEVITPAVGEPTIPNPKTRTRFLAEVGLTSLLKNISEPLRRQSVITAQKQAESSFDMAIEAIASSAEIIVTE